jgi:hypothetical protein
MEKELIGPCGMNCGVCSSYLAMKNDVMSKGVKVRYCAGCRPRRNMLCGFSKRCELLKKKQVKYCYECSKFPCENVESMNKRYSKHFHMSQIENLNYIKENGVEKFLEKEEERWKCPECGGVISCHNGICYGCRLEELKIIDKLHRWTND